MNNCKGCGIKLQNIDKNSLGYISNLEHQICERCFKIKNYGQYQTVSRTNKDYQQIINTIPNNSLIVYVADLLSLELSNIKQFQKVLLVITKRDIIPKSVKEEKIISKLKADLPNLLDLLIISSQKNYHLDELYHKLLKYAPTKEIYFVGNTNSGKSTLINKLITNYSDHHNQTTLTVSMYPSTTLDKVQVRLNDLTIIDTPGLISPNNIANYLNSSDLKKLTPKKEIKPRSCQLASQTTGSILIEKYARLDYKTTEKNSLVIYTSNAIISQFASLSNNSLKNLKAHTYTLDKNKDVVIPGLGFIKFTKPITITIYLQEPIEPEIRSNLI